MNNKFNGIASIQMNHVTNQETLNEYLKKNIQHWFMAKKIKIYDWWDFHYLYKGRIQDKVKEAITSFKK